MMVRHIQFSKNPAALHLLDQRYLPGKELIFRCETLDDIVYAIQNMVVRGAPAIGVTAAFGCVLAAGEILTCQTAWEDWPKLLSRRLGILGKARPTAVNLSWALQRMQTLWDSQNCPDLAALYLLWLEEALCIQAEDRQNNKLMGRLGASLLDDGDTVMTHCNAGALATAGYGTALGVIYAAVEEGKKIQVIANETRPLLQGARLTAYELQEQKVPVTVACDNACAWLMYQGKVDKVLIGADRIAANGDTANKIGSYLLALAAYAHKIPLYVVAPFSTIDLSLAGGSSIPIEERPANEVLILNARRISPDGVDAYNYAFDVTPAKLIAAIITEKGIYYPGKSRLFA